MCGVGNGQHQSGCPIGEQEAKLTHEEHMLESAAALPLEERVAALTDEQSRFLADADTRYTKIAGSIPSSVVQRTGRCPECRNPIDEHIDAERCA